VTAAELAESTRGFGHSLTLPAQVYTDDAVLAWERRHLFDRAWVCVGRVADLAVKPGDRTAVTVGDAGILVTCGADGVVRAVANVCRHRGHELLAPGSSANAGPIVCPYHGWAYEWDGSLRGAAWLDETPNARREDLGLVSVPAQTWGGWLFVNVDGGAAGLEHAVGSLESFVVGHELDRLVVVHRQRYELAANWKLAIENYHECWHCPVIHPALDQRTPFGSSEYLPEQQGTWVGGTMRLVEGVQTMTAGTGLVGRLLPGAEPGQAMEGRVAYVGLFPNLLLAFHPDYVLTHRLDPLSADRTTVVCEWLVPPDVAARPGWSPAEAVAFWDEVNRQDWAAVESVQRGVASPLYRRGPLGIVEDDVYGFVQMVAAAYRGEVPTGGRQEVKVR
jgi:glycine betaine catabolism A